MNTTVNSKKGTLYIVSTPIGNLKDITLRAIEILQNVDLIAAEDTRVTKKLLNHYNIKKSMVSCNDFNEEKLSSKIIEHVNNGKNIALVSDAGTPLISDPGYKIINYAIENNINIEAIPGASALLQAVVLSGLPSYPFTFWGFLPSKSQQRKNKLEEIQNSSYTSIFFESPQRLGYTLEDLLNMVPNRKIAIIKETTKRFERVYRGSIEGALSVIENFAKGEIVVALQGKEQEGVFAEEWLILLEETLKVASLADAVRLVQKVTGVSKKQVYEAALIINNKKI